MAALTPEEISQILEAFFQTVGTRQYIGARYVPIFGRRGEDSIQWDNTAPYEPLTIVQHQGNTYTSRQYVPIGVDITNTQFWASTGVYSAQIEQYRQEVLTFDARITANADAIAQLDSDLDSEIAKVTARSVLLFGDSWTDTSTTYPKWMNNAFRDMHYDHVYNYAITGAGWVQGSTINIEQQVENANAGLTQEQKESVVDIIAFALVNDFKSITTYDAFNTQSSTVLGAMRRTYETLASQYPRARIFFLPTVCGESYTNALAFGNLAIFNKRMASGTANGWSIPYNADFFNTYLQWNDSIIYADDGLHLVANGATAVSSAINKVLKGIPVPNSMQVESTVNATNGALDLNLQMAGGTARLISKFTALAALAKGDSVRFEPAAGTALHKCIVYAFCKRFAYGFGNGIINGMYSGSGNQWASQLVFSSNNAALAITTTVTRDDGLSSSNSCYGMI